MILHGTKAVAAIEAVYGPLSYAERRVVMLEGYATAPYPDTKGIMTTGVGQTGEWINKTFKEAFQHHVDRVARRFADFAEFPEYLQAELIQAEYRGDLGGSPATIRHIAGGDWIGAANEFLDNAEFHALATPESIKRRMAAVHHALMLRGNQV